MAEPFEEEIPPPTLEEEEVELHVPDNPSPRRTLTDISSIFLNTFLIFLFFTFICSSNALVVKNNFVFEKVGSDVLVNADNIIVSRRIEFSSITHSLRLMKDISKHYIQVCDMATSDYKTSFSTLFARSPIATPTPFCIAHRLAEPTVNFPEETDILLQHMQKNNMTVALSPYAARGPGHLHLQIHTSHNENVTLFVQPAIHVEPYTTPLDETFHAIYSVKNGSLSLVFIDNTTDPFSQNVATSALPVVCKYQISAKNTVDSMNTLIHNLCRIDFKLFLGERNRLRRLAKVIQPPYIRRVSRSLPVTLFLILPRN